MCVYVSFECVHLSRKCEMLHKILHQSGVRLHRWHASVSTRSLGFRVVHAKTLLDMFCSTLSTVVCVCAHACISRARARLHHITLHVSFGNSEQLQRITSDMVGMLSFADWWIPNVHLHATYVTDARGRDTIQQKKSWQYQLANWACVVCIRAIATCVRNF